MNRRRSDLARTTKGGRSAGRINALGAVCVGGLLAMMVACSGSGSTTAGTLRLVGPSTPVVVTREVNASVVVQAIVQVSSPDHNLELHVLRPAGTTAVAASLVNQNGSGTSKRLPAGIVDFNGVQQFAHYTVTGPDGSQVVEADAAWCPANRRTQVVPGTTSLVYPDSCNASPFATGVEWGVEQGWASELPVAFSLDGADGTYRVQVTVRSPVAAALGFAPNGRKVAFDAVVRTDPTAVVQPSPDDATNQSTDTTVDHTRPDAALEQVTPPADALPDIRPLPAYGISTAVDNATDVLGFNASVWNAGAPFEVEGYRNGAAEVMDAVQLFYRGAQIVAARPVGTFEYHAGGGHNHWHFLDFVRYDLVDSTGTVVATSGKQAWCLANTTAVNLFQPGTLLRPGSTALNSACGNEAARFLRESLSTGWGDTYSQAVSGQALDISKVPNGHYDLVMTTNPAGRFLEASPTPETSKRAVDLGGTAGARTVVVPDIDGISA